MEEWKHMNFSKTFTIMLCCCPTLSCSNTDTVIAPYEKILELDGSTTRSFHSMLYYPSGEGLHNPGYIIGIETSPKKTIGGPEKQSDDGLLNSDSYLNSEINSTNNTRNKIDGFTKQDRKSMFISHIIKNDFNIIKDKLNNPYITNNYCFVYNAYTSRQLVDDSGLDLTKINGWNACKISSSIQEAEDAKLHSFYKNSDSGLTALKENLKHDLESGAYSHILVIVMGWNTSQSEAVRNFNDITGNIITASFEQRKEADTNPSAKLNRMVVTRSRVIEPKEEKYNRDFRPLVIGITWPSYWSTGLVNVVSYPNKANDADELGLIWLNKIGYTDLMVDGAPSPHQSDTTLRWLIDRLRS